MSEIYFVDALEARIVPKGWEHPKDADGDHIPLLPERYWPATPEARAKWVREFGEPAHRERFMPLAIHLNDRAGHDTDVIAYETVTEGTPISPSFPNTPEGRRDLLVWCSENETTDGTTKVDAEAWAGLLFGDAVIGADGSVHASSGK
jgi:hypothetical protein